MRLKPRVSATELISWVFTPADSRPGLTECRPLPGFRGLHRRLIVLSVPTLRGGVCPGIPLAGSTAGGPRPRRTARGACLSS